ncbi:hypothetical protein H8957_017609, partial [Semnopithecus entellus]
RCRADRLAWPQPLGRLAPVLRHGECGRARGLPGGCCLHTEAGCSLGAQAGWRTAGWEARGRQDLGLEAASAHSRSLPHLSSWRRPGVGEAAGAELLQLHPCSNPSRRRRQWKAASSHGSCGPRTRGAASTVHTPRVWWTLVLPGGGWT